MSIAFFLKRSDTPDKRPLPVDLAFGEVAINYDTATGGLFYKDSSDGIIKVGPAQVSSTAPNAVPVGSSGNSAGEFWYDTSSSTLRIWNGTAWVATNTNPDYIQNSSFTAKGNLLVATGPGTFVALAVGANDEVLVADTSTPSGLKWVAGGTGGGITSITAGAGLTGGTITTTGTIALATSGVSANTYPYASITVDAYGRVTAAASGSDATTTTKGIVQLNNTTTSTSTSLALTAAQGKSLQDQISALSFTTNITFGGTFDANTGLVDSVTPEGTLGGLGVGSALPTAGPSNSEIFVIIDVQGSTGPSGTPPYYVGDWFLSNGTTWQYLGVGYKPGTATTTSEGVVQLATNAQVQAGSDSSDAVVSSSLQSKLSDSVSTTSSTTIASSTAVTTAYNLANAAIPKSSFTTPGELIVGTGSSTYSALPVGSNGQTLIVDSACVNGLKWAAASGSGTVTSITAGTGLTGGTITSSGTIALDISGVVAGSYNLAKVTVDAYGRVTSATSGSVTAVSPISINNTNPANPIVTTSLSTGRLLGRTTTGTGVAEQIAISRPLAMSGQTLFAQTACNVDTILPQSYLSITGTAGCATLTIAGGNPTVGDWIVGEGLAAGTSICSVVTGVSLTISPSLCTTLTSSDACTYSSSILMTPASTVSGLAKAWVLFDSAGGTFGGGASTVSRASGSSVTTICTTNAHGLSPGSTTYVCATTGVPAGFYRVCTTTSSTRLTISAGTTAIAAGTAITFGIANILNAFNVRSVYGNGVCWGVNLGCGYQCYPNFLVAGTASNSSGSIVCNFSINRPAGLDFVNPSAVIVCSGLSSPTYAQVFFYG